MPSLSDDAKRVIHKALEEYGGNVDKVAELWDTQRQTVLNIQYIPNCELKPITARKILRAEIAHLQAKQQGKQLEILDNLGKYKGNRMV